MGTAERVPEDAVPPSSQSDRGIQLWRAACSDLPTARRERRGLPGSTEQRSRRCRAAFQLRAGDGRRAFLATIKHLATRPPRREMTEADCPDESAVSSACSVKPIECVSKRRVPSCEVNELFAERVG